MRNWKTWQISLFTVLCIALNYGGRRLTAAVSMPLWLDSLGTVAAAYAGGPVCGAVVGVVGNLMFEAQNHISGIYCLVSVAVGLIVGYEAKKKVFRTVYGTLRTAFLTAFICIGITVPLNVIFYGGSTGNEWGNGISGYLTEQGFPKLISDILGTAALELPDKSVVMMLLFLYLRVFGAVWKKRKRTGAAGAAALLILLTGTGFFLTSVTGTGVSAAEPVTAIDYNDYVQTVFNSTNGLNCGEANDIAMTGDGILWIGTYNGLYRFNGREFRWMQEFESVRNVNCLFVDEEGRLWVGTNDTGLSICINEKIVNVIDKSGGLPSNTVRNIIQGSDGYYYIGTAGAMQILSLSGGLKRCGTLPEISSATELCADGNGNVAAVTKDGRLFLLRKGQIQSSIRLLSDEVFCSCGFDEKGRLLAGTNLSAVYIYDISSGGFEQTGVLELEGASHINTISPLESGQLFIASDSGAGYLDARERFHPINTGSFNNSIDHMLVDYQDNMWLTSSRLGLLRLAPSSFKEIYSTVGMETHVVNAVARWQDDYYFGTDSGLDKVDGTCHRQLYDELTDLLKGIRIRCLFVDKDDHLWICTYTQGVWEVEPDGTRYEYTSENGSFGSKTRVVMQLSNGEIVAAGDEGISFYKDHRVTKTLLKSEGAVASEVLTLTELPDGTLLAGTNGGGIIILKDYQTRRSLTADDGLSSEVILRLVRDTASGGVFIVTSNGLCYMDEDFRIRELTGFPYFNNYDIWEKGNGKLFVLSSAGVFVIDRDVLVSDRKDPEYELLDASRGLNGSLTANSWILAEQDGRLFLPCDRGVFIIDTDRYSIGSYSYRMKLSRLVVDGEDQILERDAPIYVERGANQIELFPEIINYTIQDPYAGYYLEGSGMGWTVVPQSSLTSISYTNLPVGEYKLHLAVFDSDKEKILEERIYPLIKEKEIYDEPWFRIYMLTVLLLVVSIGVGLVMYGRYTKAMALKNRQIELQARELALANRQVEMGNQTIFAIINAVDAKDERTRAHSDRVAFYSSMIAKEMGYSEEECRNIENAAKMHDIGKIAIPDNILNKPSRLTDEEYEVMKSHVEKGAKILSGFTLLEHVVEGARYHHERYDGKGYPEGLKGEEIPLYGRLIGVADAFDAMTSNRVYRNQMDMGYVINEIRKGRGNQFDPVFADVMLKIIERDPDHILELYTKVQQEDE